MRKKPFSNRQDLLRVGIDFHGHLGPFLVFGLRMGRVAVQRLKPKHIHELSATVWTKTSPPQSCVLDGIQVSSGCTLGKGNIRVEKSQRTKVKFWARDRALVIEPSKKAQALLSGVSHRSPELEVREIALALHRMSDRDLFRIF
jgi:formylmethanofuran dehydrogenase subunit E